MLDWITNPGLLFGGIVLAAVQFVAALPWLWAIDPRGFERATRTGSTLGYVVGGVIAAGIAVASYAGYKSDAVSLEWNGRYVYGAVLHLQLLIDLFILMPNALVMVWPKGGAVALAAYREGLRQPMSWLIVVVAVVATWVSVFIPYFTFGDDFKMMKQIGFDVVMLAAALFGVLAASMSISEEIEGRTAVTLMSKPVNRRQFLIGKFLGILMACLALSLVIGWNLTYSLRAQPEFDKINEVVDPMPQQAEAMFVPVFAAGVPGTAPKVIARGAGAWFADSFAHSLGIALGFGQVMILVAIASALGHATAVRHQHRAVPADLLPWPPRAGDRAGDAGRHRHGDGAGRVPGATLRRAATGGSSSSTWGRRSSARARSTCGSSPGTSPPCSGTPCCTPASPYWWASCCLKTATSPRPGLTSRGRPSPRPALRTGGTLLHSRVRGVDRGNPACGFRPRLLPSQQGGGGGRDTRTRHGGGLRGHLGV